MTLKRMDLVLDLFYSSLTLENRDRQAIVTLQLRDGDSVIQHITQLVCTTSADNQKKMYTTGERFMKSGTDPLLVAVEQYWRQNAESEAKKLLAQVMTFIEGDVNTGNTCMGSYGITVVSGAALSGYLPESVLSSDRAG